MLINSPEFLAQLNLTIPADLLSLIQQAWQVRRENFAPVLFVSRPTATESISVPAHSAPCTAPIVTATTWVP